MGGRCSWTTLPGASSLIICRRRLRCS